MELSGGPAADVEVETIQIALLSIIGKPAHTLCDYYFSLRCSDLKETDLAISVLAVFSRDQLQLNITPCCNWIFAFYTCVNIVFSCSVFCISLKNLY